MNSPLLYTLDGFDGSPIQYLLGYLLQEVFFSCLLVVPGMECPFSFVGLRPVPLWLTRGSSLCHMDVLCYFCCCGKTSWPGQLKGEFFFMLTVPEGWVPIMVEKHGGKRQAQWGEGSWEAEGLKFLNASRMQRESKLKAERLFMLNIQSQCHAFICKHAPNLTLSNESH